MSNTTKSEVERMEKPKPPSMRVEMKGMKHAWVILLFIPLFLVYVLAILWDKLP